MKVLSIGNSFSQDAQRNLHAMAKEHGIALRAINLFIGGCPLRTHYLNMLNNTKAYSYEFNGEVTGMKVTLAEALSSDVFDVVTIQQASPNSGNYATYQPYATELAAYVRKYCPHTKLMIHETWAYEEGSPRLMACGNFESARAMHAAVRDSYEKLAADVNAHGIIRSGDAMILAAEEGLTVHRDGAHVSMGVGRYLLSLCWLRKLTGVDISNDTYMPIDAPITEEERAIVIRAVNAAVR